MANSLIASLIASYSSVLKSQLVKTKATLIPAAIGGAYISTVWALDKYAFAFVDEYRGSSSGIGGAFIH